MYALPVRDYDENNEQVKDTERNDHSGRRQTRREKLYQSLRSESIQKERLVSRVKHSQKVKKERKDPKILKYSSDGLLGMRLES